MFFIGHLIFGENLWSATPLRKGPLDWGLYQIYWGFRDYPSNVNKELNQLLPKSGVQPKYLMFFRDLIRPFPKEAIEFNASKGMITIISLEPLTWSRGRNKSRDYLKEIINGKFDSHFRKWAQSAVSYGGQVIYRFGFEMNGGWFSWGQRPEEFKKAWKHIHGIFTSKKATNVQWMFSPNVLWGDKTFSEDILPYYPGEQYVDLLGLDGYNFGDDSKPYHSWQSYSQVFSKSISGMQAFSHPLFISEVSCAADSRKAQWISEFLKSINGDRRIHGFIWFNLDKRSEGEQNWRIDSDAESFKIFKKWLKNPEKNN